MSLEACKVSRFCIKSWEMAWKSDGAVHHGGGDDAQPQRRWMCDVVCLSGNAAFIVWPLAVAPQGKVLSFGVGLFILGMTFLVFQPSSKPWLSHTSQSIMGLMSQNPYSIPGFLFSYFVKS